MELPVAQAPVRASHGAQHAGQLAQVVAPVVGEKVDTGHGRIEPEAAGPGQYDCAGHGAHVRLTSPPLRCFHTPIG